MCLRQLRSKKEILTRQCQCFNNAAKISFNVAELDNFKEMIQILRPGYKTPIAKDICGKLLDDAAQQTELHLVEKVQNCSLTVTLDGWSSVKNDPIQAVTIQTGTESYHLKVYDAVSKKKKSEQCAAIEAAMKECQKNLHSNIFAVVTTDNNENKMDKVREILKEKHPDLITYSCSALLLNLVEKDREITLEHAQDSHPNVGEIFNLGIYHTAVYHEKQLHAIANALGKLQKETT
ncbi:hypothetical protein PR048_026579 [Dryococelus australis]|uniref:DUF659 domain-containing protein n=1 Tax=Dryococelus australis TaxID=614101 RepID=A0ABQ9GLS3_9NEOP|nr:hypothetical protein PR048_026579 [Dryococelus australis]